MTDIDFENQEVRNHLPVVLTIDCNVWFTLSFTTELGFNIAFGTFFFGSSFFWVQESLGGELLGMLHIQNASILLIYILFKPEMCLIAEDDL